ncbi:MAG: prephenate dehydratase domain-containing protein [Eubacterium sp.]
MCKNILEAMQKGEVQHGVLRVENSTAGPVGEFLCHTFENISYEKLAVYVLPIHHCLFKKPGVDAAALQEVASHPQALRQTINTTCKEKFPDLKELEIEDTAIGAEWLAKGILPETTAAICSARAGKLWDLEMIAENIEDSSENRTTFWLLKLV